MRSIPLGVVCTLLSLRSLAQLPSTDPLNAHFAGLVVFRVDKHDRLVLDISDQGTRIRQDDMDPLDLDPSAIDLAPEEDGIVLKCRTDRSQCITKEIFKLDVVRVTSRVTIPRPPGDPDATGAVRLLKDWLAAAQAHGDQADNGTTRPSVRKNVPSHHE
jgi:hypothetical protein